MTSFTEHTFGGEGQILGQIPPYLNQCIHAKILVCYEHRPVFDLLYE